MERIGFGGKDEQGPPTRAHDERRTWPAVVALRDQATGAEIAIAGERRYVVGHSTSCDVVVADPFVSRVHCVIERHDDTVYVRDKGSRNGTFINDRRVESAELTSGTELTVGNTRFLVLGPRSGPSRSAFARLIGNDVVFRQAIEHARRAALAEVSVLIVGETGTGKELVAQAIHEASPRARGPFVALNCGAIPRELIGSELYGHERGAFTGAMVERDGVFVHAERGTLFLDELGELALEQQPHLLRALETRRVRRIGASTERAVDVRIVAATNRLVGLGSERGHLRIDLYHRIATVLVHLPPLRQRLGDLDDLCADILGELAGEYGPRTLTPSARRALRDHSWPGNVRELRQALTRAATFSTDEILVEHLFPPVPRRTPPPSPLPPGDPLVSDVRAILDVPRYESMVREAMLTALGERGTIRGAADAIGIPKSTFADKARRLGIQIPTSRPGRRP